MLYTHPDPETLHIPTLDLHVAERQDEAAEFLKITGTDAKKIYATTHNFSGWATVKQLEIYALIDQNRDVLEGAKRLLQQVDRFRSESLPILKFNRDAVRAVGRRLAQSSGPDRLPIHQHTVRYTRAVDSAQEAIELASMNIRALIARANECRGQSTIMRAAKTYEIAVKHVLGIDVTTKFLPECESFGSTGAVEIPVDAGTCNSREARSKIRDRIIDCVAESDENLVGHIGIIFVDPSFSKVDSNTSKRAA